MKTLIAAIFLYSGLAANASAITIGFEEFTSDDLHYIARSQGYSLDANGDIIFIGSGLGAGNSYGLGLPSEVLMTLSNESAAPFNLLSIDALSFASVAPLWVTGFFAGGGEISTTIQVSGDVYAEIRTYNFSNAWQDLSAVTFQTNANMNMDNLVVTAVPIPAAAWLFGSALAGLGWMRRKQTV